MSMDAGKNIIVPFVRNVASDLLVYAGYDMEAGSANDVLGVFYIPFKCTVRMLGLYVTEVVAASTTSPVIYFDEAALGTIPTEDGDLAIMTIADETAAGTILYNKPVTLATPERMTLEPGKWVVVSMQTDIADAGTETGFVMPFLIVDHVPETEANQSAYSELEA